MTQQFFLIEEFAARARISRQTAYIQVKSGGIPGAFRVGKQWRIPVDVFEKLTEGESVKNSGQGQGKG